MSELRQSVDCRNFTRSHEHLLTCKSFPLRSYENNRDLRCLEGWIRPGSLGSGWTGVWPGTNKHSALKEPGSKGCTCFFRSVDGWLKVIDRSEEACTAFASWFFQ